MRRLPWQSINRSSPSAPSHCTLYSTLFGTSHPEGRLRKSDRHMIRFSLTSQLPRGYCNLSAGYDAAVHHHVRRTMLPSENILTLTQGSFFFFLMNCSDVTNWQWVSTRKRTAGTAADAAFVYMSSRILIWPVWHCDELIVSTTQALLYTFLFCVLNLKKNKIMWPMLHHIMWL